MLSQINNVKKSSKDPTRFPRTRLVWKSSFFFNPSILYICLQSAKASDFQASYNSLFNLATQSMLGPSRTWKVLPTKRFGVFHLCWTVCRGAVLDTPVSVAMLKLFSFKENMMSHAGEICLSGRVLSRGLSNMSAQRECGTGVLTAARASSSTVRFLYEASEWDLVCGCWGWELACLGLVSRGQSPSYLVRSTAFRQCTSN